MDQFQSDARKAHGNFLYNITWKARETDQKWLWGVVALVATLQFVWIHMAIFALSTVLTNLIFGRPWHASVLVGMLIGVIVTPVFVPMFQPSRTISVVSSYYSIAGDMKRVYDAKKNPIYKALYLLFGGVAFLLVSIMLLFHSNIMSYGVTQQDVIASVLSKAGRWKKVRQIYMAIEKRYDHRASLKKSDQEQVIVTYGLACKWMLDDPLLTKEQYYKFIEQILKIRATPGLPERITMRYDEALRHGRTTFA